MNGKQVIPLICFFLVWPLEFGRCQEKNRSSFQGESSAKDKDIFAILSTPLRPRIRVPRSGPFDDLVEVIKKCTHLTQHAKDFVDFLLYKKHDHNQGNNCCEYFRSECPKEKYPEHTLRLIEERCNDPTLFEATRRCAGLIPINGSATSLLGKGPGTVCIILLSILRLGYVVFYIDL